MKNAIAHKPARCPRCQCLVIVWKRPGFNASILRKLAMADHDKALHSAQRQNELRAQKLRLAVARERDLENLERRKAQRDLQDSSL